jgi:hypothetical protein
LLIRLGICGKFGLQLRPAVIAPGQQPSARQQRSARSESGIAATDLVGLMTVLPAASRMLGLDFLGDFRMAAQEFAGIVLALADFFALVGIPGTGFVDQLVGDAEFDDFAFAGNAFAVENVENRFAERRRRPCS